MTQEIKEGGDDRQHHKEQWCHGVGEQVIKLIFCCFFIVSNSARFGGGQLSMVLKCAN